MWFLATAWALATLVFPWLALALAWGTGLPIRRVGLGSGPPVVRGAVAGLELQVGALPFGSWLGVAEDDDTVLPGWFLLTPHAAVTLLGSGAGWVAGPGLWVAGLRRLAGLCGLAALPPFPGWSRLWALDAAHPAASASAAVAFVGAINLVLAVLQVAGRSQPPVGCGLAVVWGLFLARACVWTAR